MLPKRVLKGKKLPGHMGVDTVTIQNLEVIEVNIKENYMLIFIEIVRIFKNYLDTATI